MSYRSSPPSLAYILVAFAAAACQGDSPTAVPATDAAALHAADAASTLRGDWQQTPEYRAIDAMADTVRQRAQALGLTRQQLRAMDETTLWRTLNISAAHARAMSTRYVVSRRALLAQYPELVRSATLVAPKNPEACTGAFATLSGYLQRPLTAARTLSPGSVVHMGAGGAIPQVASIRCRTAPYLACAAVCAATIEAFPIFLACQYGCQCSFCDDQGGFCG